MAAPNFQVLLDLGMKMPDGWVSPGRRASNHARRSCLEDAEHDGSDKGKGEIRGHNAQSADESHGKAPLVTSLSALIREPGRMFRRKKAILLSVRRARSSAVAETWLSSREINALKSP